MAAATVEICADSVAGARVAAKAGAHRVELCADLIEGGITPSYGLIKQVRNAIGGSNSRTRLMVLIRPRGGDFMYVEEEVCVSTTKRSHGMPFGSNISGRAVANASSFVTAHFADAGYAG